MITNFISLSNNTATTHTPTLPVIVLYMYVAAGSTILIDGEKVGHVTSGCPSPSLKLNVAMGYVNTQTAKSGAKLQIETRKKLYDAVISKMPFLPSNYYMMK